MDSLRFGRALGIGARSAAKALAGAAEAAAASNPSPARPRTAAPAPVPTPDATPNRATRPANICPIDDSVRTGAGTAAQATVQASVQVRRAGENITRGGRRFGESTWRPFVRLSGVLWLEVTGAFFGLFALFAGAASWTHRSDLYSSAANRDDRFRAFVFLAMAVAFGYFCLSSFIRARRRERSR